MIAHRKSEASVPTPTIAPVKALDKQRALLSVTGDRDDMTEWQSQRSACRKHVGGV